MLRKQVGTTPATIPPSGEIDVFAVATVLVTSESPDDPIDHAFDGRRGPGEAAGSPQNPATRRSSWPSTPRR
jgi:hypothetical protein